MDDLPSIRTIARILKRAGMVQKRCRRRTTRETRRPDISVVDRCNQLWTADFEGSWFEEMLPRGAGGKQ